MTIIHYRYRYRYLMYFLTNMYLLTSGGSVPNPYVPVPFALWRFRPKPYIGVWDGTPRSQKVYIAFTSCMMVMCMLKNRDFLNHNERAAGEKFENIPRSNPFWDHMSWKAHRGSWIWPKSVTVKVHRGLGAKPPEPKRYIGGLGAEPPEAKRYIGVWDGTPRSQKVKS